MHTLQGTPVTSNTCTSTADFSDFSDLKVIKRYRQEVEQMLVHTVEPRIEYRYHLKIDSAIESCRNVDSSASWKRL